MTDDVRKVIYGTIIGFLVVVLSWLTLIYLSACGFTLSCYRATPLIVRTPVPTLIPMKLPAATQYVAPPPTPTLIATLPPESDTPVPGEPAADVARPSNPGGPGPALGLQGDANRGKEIYAANCEYCHAAEGKGGLPNPGSTDGTVPALNPIDPTLVNADLQVFAYNLDLFLEHGSVPEGPEPTRSMPAWGDNGALAPQQIADVIAYIISLNH